MTLNQLYIYTSIDYILPDTRLREMLCLGGSPLYDIPVISHQLQQLDGVAGGGLPLLQPVVEHHVPLRHVLLEVVIVEIVLEELRELDVMGGGKAEDARAPQGFQYLGGCRDALYGIGAPQHLVHEAENGDMIWL